MASIELLKKKLAKAKNEQDKESFLKIKSQIKKLQEEVETEGDAEDAEVKSPKTKKDKTVVDTAETKPVKTKVSKKKLPLLRSPEVIVEVLTQVFKENLDENFKLKLSLEEFNLICKGEPDDELFMDIKRLLSENKIHVDVVEDMMLLTKLNVFKKAKKLSKSAINKAIKELVASENENENEDE